MALRWKNAAMLCFCLVVASSTDVQGAGGANGALRGKRLAEGGVTNAASKVTVELYEEALCPFCAEFITLQLNDLFKSGLIEIVDLKVIPYGNAQLLPNRTIWCQHGPEECQLNLVESCIIHLYPEVSKWLPFLVCLEGKPRAEMLHQVQNCIEEFKFSPAVVRDCVDGPLGDKLILANRLETEGLQPPHRWTPWVLINGVPITDTFDNFQERICKAYRGVRPAACPKATLGSEAAPETGGTQLKNGGQVCMREETHAETSVA